MDIKKFIRMAKCVVPKKTAVSVFRELLIKDWSITAASSDLMLVMETGQERFDIPFTISFSAFSKLEKIRSLGDVIEFNPDAIKAGDYFLNVSSLTSQDIEDYPIGPVSKVYSQIDTWTPEFIKRIGKLKNYLSKDSLRPALTGILFEYDEKREAPLVLTGTDGYRAMVTGLQRNSGLHNPITENYSFILPDIFRLLSLIGSNSTSPVGVCLSLDKLHLCLQWDEYKLFIRLISETYPDVEKNLPDAGETMGSITFSRQEVAEYLQEILGVLDAEQRAIMVDVGGDAFEMTAFNNKKMEQQSSAEADEEKTETDNEPDITRLQKNFAGVHNGDAFSICINAKYLLDILASVEESDHVTLVYFHWAKACLITIDDHPAIVETKILLMPIRHALLPHKFAHEIEIAE